MQALIDPAVMIITMVIPALGSQLFQEALHHSLPQEKVVDVLSTAIRCTACDIIIMTHARCATKTLRNGAPNQSVFPAKACPGLDPGACPGLDPGRVPPHVGKTRLNKKTGASVLILSEPIPL